MSFVFVPTYYDMDAYCWPRVPPRRPLHRYTLSTWTSTSATSRWARAPRLRRLRSQHLLYDCIEFSLVLSRWPVRFST